MDMYKVATLIGIGLCLVASQAFAETNARSGGTLTVADSSGLWVRSAAPSSDMKLTGGNVCASAINTDGIRRATRAVKIGGRVFLTSGRGMGRSPALLAAITAHEIRNEQPRKAPQGLGALFARLFGLAKG